MRKFMGIIAVAAGLLGVGQSLATDLDLRRLPYTELFTDASQQGESKDDFLFRVAKRMRAYSDETGFEACGMIAKATNDGVDTYSIVAGTSTSHLACAIYSSKIPAGTVATKEGIHSHGRVAQFRMNRADRILSGVSDDPRSISQAVVYGQNLNAFSEQDLSGIAGYLATENGLLYHDTKGAITTIR